MYLIKDNFSVKPHIYGKLACPAVNGNPFYCWGQGLDRNLVFMHNKESNLKEEIIAFQLRNERRHRMTTAELVIQGINQLWQEADEASKLADQKTRAAAEKTSRLVEAIKEGQTTTGNPIFDFTIAAYNTTKADIAIELSYLQAQLGPRQGQFILVVQVSEEPMKTVCMGRVELQAHDFRIREDLSLGLIQGDKLLITITPNETSCAFPTDCSYVFSADSDAPRAMLGKNLGANRAYPVDYRNLKKPLECRNSAHQYRSQRLQPGQLPKDPQPYLALEILVGDVAVLGWFTNQESVWYFELRNSPRS